MTTGVEHSATKTQNRTSNVGAKIGAEQRPVTAARPAHAGCTGQEACSVQQERGGERGITRSPAAPQAAPR